jgi:hypothetical protein
MDEFKCTVCGKRLGAWFRGDICSAKCRQKKSRDKKQAGARAWRIGADIEKLFASYKSGAIDIDDAIMHHNALLNKIQKLTKQLSEDLQAQQEKRQFKAGRP